MPLSTILVAILIVLLVVSLLPQARVYGGYYPSGGLGLILIIVLILLLLGRF